jgi:hypothetical protein
VRTRLRSLYQHGRSWTWTVTIGEVTDDHFRRRSIRLRIWGAGKNSRAAQVDLISTTPTSGRAEPADDDSAYPSAEHVRLVIDHALESGWNPDATGGTFLIPDTGRAGHLELIGFRIH